MLKYQAEDRSDEPPPMASALLRRCALVLSFGGWLSSCAVYDGFSSKDDDGVVQLGCPVIDVPVDVHNGNDQQLVDTCSEAENDTDLQVVAGCLEDNPFAPTFSMALPGFASDQALDAGAYHVCAFGIGGASLVAEVRSEFSCDDIRSGSCLQGGCVALTAPDPSHIFLHWQGNTCEPLTVTAYYMGRFLPTCFSDNTCWDRIQAGTTFGGDEIELADFDEDGRLDFLNVQRDWSQDPYPIWRVRFHFGDGAGRFGNIEEAPFLELEEGVFAVAVAETDGDVAPEIVFSGPTELIVYKIGPDRSPSVPTRYTTGIACDSLITIRLPGSDALDDFVCIAQSSGRLHLLDSSNDYAATLIPFTGTPDEVRVGDTNGDGIPDIAYRSGFSTVGVLAVASDGSISEAFSTNVGGVESILPFGSSLAVGRFCQDCEAEEAVVLLDASGQQISQWTFTGPGMFAHLRGAADLDGDGANDLLLSNSRGLALPVLVAIRGGSDGRSLIDDISAPHDLFDRGSTVGVSDAVVGDIDGANGADILVTDGYQVTVYLSSPP